MIYKSIMDMGTQPKTKNRKQTEAANVAAATGVQKEQTENREQTNAANVAAAMGVQKEQTEHSWSR